VTAEPPTFAVVYRPGPAWDATVPFHRQNGVHRHRDFLAAQHDAERLLLGGPFLDDCGGLAVYRAAGIEELESILQTDETVAEGLLRYEIHPFAIAFTSA